MLSHQQRLDSFALTDLEEPQIIFLKGEQWGTESTRRVFKHAQWLFHPDKTFRFTPPQAADIRDDLYPINGTYTITHNLLEFAGEKLARHDMAGALSELFQEAGPWPVSGAMASIMGVLV